MGWKGTLRSLEAAARRAERDAARRQRELQRLERESQKLRDLAHAALEVDVFENKLEYLQSFHKEIPPFVDWAAMAAAHPGVAPVRSSTHEEAARERAEAYRPSIIDRLLFRVEGKARELYDEVKLARKADDEDFRNAQRSYAARESEWQLAQRVLANESGAFEEALRVLNPMGELRDLGSDVTVTVLSPDVASVELTVHADDVVPEVQKALLKSGKLSTKKMTQSRRLEIYQDHVCSCVLRIANELFAALPIRWTIVTALGDLLDSSTGHLEVRPILSVGIPRDTLEGLNLEMVDPSDSMENFVVRMNFTKRNGFSAVSKLEPSDLGVE